MRYLQLILALVVVGCAGRSTRAGGGGATPVPALLGPVDSALFRQAILRIVPEPATAERVVVATRRLEGDGLSPSVTFDLGASPASAVAERAAVLQSLGLAATADVSWGRCPASTARTANRAACPAALTRRLAVGAPVKYPRDLELGRLHSAPCAAEGATQCWMVRLLETSLAPDGAQSRTEFLYFQQRNGSWVLADRKQGTTVE